jgi:hypothetical protein
MQAHVDVVIKALSRLQCVTLDLCLGGALKDALIRVVAHPPVAGCWDSKYHEFAGIARYSSQCFLQGNRTVTFMGVGFKCSGHVVLTIFAVGVRQSLLWSDREDDKVCCVFGTRIPCKGDRVFRGCGVVLLSHSQYSLGSMITQRSLSHTE